jgi:hypothetical protein
MAYSGYRLSKIQVYPFLPPAAGGIEGVRGDYDVSHTSAYRYIKFRTESENWKSHNCDRY